MQLARAEREGESLTLTQLARFERISVANAGKLMCNMNKAGVVQSTRGSKSEYTLARPANEIRLNEVISVLDHNTVQNHCQSYTGVMDKCVHTGDCGIRPVIVELHQVVDNALAEITLCKWAGTKAKIDGMLHSIQGLKPRGDSRLRANWAVCGVSLFKLSQGED